MYACLVHFDPSHCPFPVLMPLSLTAPRLFLFPVSTPHTCMSFFQKTFWPSRVKLRLLSWAWVWVYLLELGQLTSDYILEEKLLTLTLKLLTLHITSELEVRPMSPSPIHIGVLIGSILCRPYVDNHMSSQIQQSCCIKKTAFHSMSLYPLVPIKFLPPSLAMFHEPWGREWFICSS